MHNLSQPTRFAIFLFLVGSSYAQNRDKQLPAEERRLGAALFREGLKDRGLTDLLELHMKDFPPESPVAVLLMRREVKLSESRNAALEPPIRKAALGAANDLLRQVIEESPGDVRRFGWLLSLGRSLLYEEAAPYSSAILYVGGTAPDRKNLRSFSGRAVETIRSLTRRLKAEYDRIDRMSAREFEALEASGVLDTLDRISPQADYLLIWGLFYDAVARDPDDPVRVSELNEIISTLTARPAILRTPQDQNPVQIPALLVAGMSQRRLNDHHRARDYLDRARAAYERIAIVDERERMRQAITLAEIESVRNDRDDERFRAATKALGRLEELIDETPENDLVDPYLLRTSHALLSRSLHLARAESAAHLGRKEESETHRAEAWKPLADLVYAIPHRRKGLYTTVYRQLPADAHFDALDPFEKVASIVGLVANEKLDEALQLADIFLDGAKPCEQLLVPEALYQVATAHYQRKENAKAAAFFLRIVREYSAWPGALRAGELAVKLSYAETLEASRSATANNSTKSSVRMRYKSAMRALLDKFPDSAQANYWRFFYAQVLLGEGAADGAAALLADVGPDHPHFLESLGLSVRATARQLKTSGSGSTEANLIKSYERLIAHCDEIESHGIDGSKMVELNAFRAEGLITTCEGLIIASVGRDEQAVEMLVDFETRYPEQDTLRARRWRARLWRVRLTAYEALGDLKQLRGSIPKYVASDNRGAGETLQALYDATIGEFHRLGELGESVAARTKAMTGLVLARQLSEWAEGKVTSVSPARKRVILLQLAEANLLTGDPDRASELFGILAPDDNILASEWTDLDARTLLGKAETLRQRGEYNRALAIFNRLATRLSPQLRSRWEALLGDLQCRTALLEAAEGIIQVIEQQRFLYPQMGGTAMAERFDRLLSTNKQRVSQGATKDVP